MTDFQLQPVDAAAVARDIDFCFECGDLDTARTQLGRLIELLDSLEWTEEEAVQEVEIPARVYTSAAYVAAVRKRPVPELRIVRRVRCEWVAVDGDPS